MSRHVALMCLDIFISAILGTSFHETSSSVKLTCSIEDEKTANQTVASVSSEGEKSWPEACGIFDRSARLSRHSRLYIFEPRYVQRMRQ
jgi:hypothetical protein